MKSENEKKLDQFFKDGLTDLENHISFREEDWAKMQKLLAPNRRDKGAVIWFYRLATGIAALLFLLLGWQFLKPVHQSRQKPNLEVRTKSHPVNATPKSQHSNNQYGNLVTKGEKAGTVNTGSPRPVNAAPKSQLSDTQYAGLTTKGKKTGTVSNYGLNSPAHKTAPISSNTLIAQKSQFQNNILPTSRQNNANGVANEAEPTANHKNVKLQPELLAASGVTGLQTDTPAALPALAINKAPDTLKINKPKEKHTSVAVNIPPRFTLAVLTAPDINGVGSLSGGKLGTNAGLLFTVKLGSKWSIASGVAYAVKPYGYAFRSSNSSTYTYKGYTYTSSANASNIDVYANCKVVDIPLNINYALYNKGKNSFSLGTGLSSYFMLHEYYQFNYTNSPSRSINISNQNRHPFGVVNLDVSYSRQLSPGLSLIVQPYYKLPITHIGYEKVNLQSGGVAVGFGWSFSALRIK